MRKILSSILYLLSLPFSWIYERKWGKFDRIRGITKEAERWKKVRDIEREFKQVDKLN